MSSGFGIGPPPVYQDLSTSNDWPVKKAITDERKLDMHFFFVESVVGPEPPASPHVRGCCDSCDHGDLHRLPWPVSDLRHDTDMPDGTKSFAIDLFSFDLDT